MVKQMTGSVYVFKFMLIFVFVVSHMPVLKITGRVYCLIVMAQFVRAVDQQQACNSTSPWEPLRVDIRHWRNLEEDAEWLCKVGLPLFFERVIEKSNKLFILDTLINKPVDHLCVNMNTYDTSTPECAFVACVW